MDFSWVGKYWVEEVFGVIVAGLGFAVRSLSKKLKKSRQEDTATKEAVLSLLDDRMGQLADHCRRQGYATRDEARRYERMYQAYHNLGGNGAVTNEHNQFMKIEVRIG